MMIVGSVWYESVDSAFLNFLTLVKTYNELNELVTVPSFVRNPEEEFEIENFPAISITHLPEQFASQRFGGEPIVVSVDKQNNTCLVSPPALPYDLYIQIDFWSEYNSDMDEMTRKWMGNTGRNFVLTVVDTENITRYCNVTLMNTNSSEEKKGSSVKYHKSYTYRVWVELDERQPVQKNVVITRVIDNKGG